MRTVRLKDVVLGEGPAKVLVPITPATIDELVTQVDALANEDYDILEWRIDFLQAAPDLAACREAAAVLAEHTDRPVLATFRTADEGGEKAISSQDYVALLGDLAASGNVAAVDVELFRGDEIARTIIDNAHAADVAVVASFHNFDATPAAEEIVERLVAMDEAGADIPKLACMPHDAGDLLTLLRGTWEAAQRIDRPLITMSMGQTGVLSRAAGEIFGSAATFGMVGRASAPGQVPVNELRPVLAAIHRWSFGQ